MILWNHERKLLRNINKFLEEWVIEDFVEARYNTIKQFVELHKKDWIYDWFIEEIRWENFNLYRVKNFLDSLPFYKTITTWTRKKYLVTHSPLLVPENPWNIKKSIAIFGAEQLKENRKKYIFSLKREKKYTWRTKKETFLSFQDTQRYIFSASEKKKYIFKLIRKKYTRGCLMLFFAELYGVWIFFFF